MEPKKTPRERAEDLIRLLVPDLQPTPQQVLWAITIAIIVSLLVSVSYSNGITVWDWIKLLIVPAFIAGAGIWFNQQQRRRELKIEDQRAQDQALQSYIDQMSQMIADKDQPLHGAKPREPLSLVAQLQTRTVLRRVGPQHKREVVQFLSEMGLIQSSQLDSIVEKLMAKLEKQQQHQDKDGEKDDTVEAEPTLDDLDSDVYGPSHPIVVSLQKADLRGTDLRGIELANVDMSYADLRGANLDKVPLPNAKLVRAKLNEATLRSTNLSGVNLNDATLNNADLSGAHLLDADLIDAHLQHAILRDAMLGGDTNMERAELQGADLTGVELFPKNLTEANMSGAKGITESKVFQIRASYGHIALEGAIMPDGQTLRGEKVPNGPTFKDWLEGKQRRELDGKNE